MKFSILTLVLFIAAAGTAFSQTGSCKPPSPIDKLTHIGKKKVSGSKVLSHLAEAAPAMPERLGAGQTDSAASRSVVDKLNVPILEMNKRLSANAGEGFATLSFTDDRLKYGLPPSTSQDGFPAEGGSGGVRKKAKK